jgi:plastocyanin
MKTLHLIVCMSTLAAAIACGGSGTSYGSGPTGGGGGGGGGNTCSPGSGTVCIVAQYVGTTSGYAFDPTPITVAAGSTVTWTNTTGVQHNVTFSTVGSPHSSANFTTAYAVAFPTAGTYSYRCTIHNFSGTVVVQ